MFMVLQLVGVEGRFGGVWADGRGVKRGVGPAWTDVWASGRGSHGFACAGVPAGVPWASGARASSETPRLACTWGVAVGKMATLEFGRLRDAWSGEATDFTPLLAEQLDMLGAAIRVDLMAVG